MSLSPRADPAAGRASRALRIVGDYQKRVLDPVDRFSEVIFGLIMVLTFTGALSVAESGRQEVRQMLVGALACNVAWGLVDGVMYALTSMAGRARAALVLDGIRAADAVTARSIVLAALPEGVAGVTDDAAADLMVARIRAFAGRRGALRPTLEDLKGAGMACLLVVLATLPPTVPFLLFGDATRALRISNGLAVASLFLAGASLGKAIGVRPWTLGLAMVLLGAALVGLTMALGG
jgi:VIT1/CCC1 family predicted Fe2+/Mn2+ transporter